MKFIDDEQYYRWLRVSLSFSIVLLMLTAPGIKADELEIAGLKFGTIGANLLRYLVLSGAVYAVLQYAMTSWMSARRAALFAPADGIQVVSRATLVSDAAEKRLEDLRRAADEIARLPLLTSGAAVTIDLEGTSVPVAQLRPAFHALRAELAASLRRDLAKARPDEISLGEAQLDQIAQAAADAATNELYERFSKSLNSYDRRTHDTAYQVGQLNELFKTALAATHTNLDRAQRGLTGLHGTLRRLEFGRDAKFVFLELVPTIGLFAAAIYRFVALGRPAWWTVFKLVSL